MEKTKVIIDVDTGSDDAIAIITAVLSEELDLLGITTVNGNQPLKNTTENTLRVMDLLNSDIPVYEGCGNPIVANLLPERELKVHQSAKVVLDGEVIQYHGEYLPLPESKRKVEEKKAVLFIIDTLLKSEGDITLIAVGPLTNIAVAMRADPRITKKIKRLVIMGGGFEITNRTSSAEFNMVCDPEAAQIVMTSGCDILLVPLDATHKGYVTKEESSIIRAFNNPIAELVSTLLDERIRAYDVMQPIGIKGVTPPHDALAVCAVIDETVLTDIQNVRVDVDFAGGVADGMTVLDRRKITDLSPNVNVAFGCDRNKFLDMLFKRFNFI